MTENLLAHLQSVLGVGVIIALAWALSENRRAFRFRMVGAALLLQLAIALLLLKFPPARAVLLGLNEVVDALSQATTAGATFVFGYVAGGGTPFFLTHPPAPTPFVFGYVAGGVTPFSITNPRALTSFAFGVLPLVIVISALSSLLWYWRILPLIVRGIAFVLRRALGLGGATALASGATVFLGMIEAPLLIRPCLTKMTRTELFILFSVGLASVAGTMFVLYATVLKDVLPDALGNVLVASMMALPAAVMIARVMVPGDATTEEVPAQLGYRSSMDAVAKGTEDGLKIYLQIMALLIVMIA